MCIWYKMRSINNVYLVEDTEHLMTKVSDGESRVFRKIHSLNHQIEILE